MGTAGSSDGSARWQFATRMAVSIGVAVLAARVTVVPVPTVSPAVRLSATQSTPDSTASLVCGTTRPTWDAAGVELIMNQFITPTHPGQTITAADARRGLAHHRTLSGSWSGIRVSCWWPSMAGGAVVETFGPVPQSIEAGVVDLREMAAHGNDHLVIYGYSQGAVVAVKEKRKLAEQYPAGTTRHIDFVLGGDVGLPNGGFGCLIVFRVHRSYDRATPTDPESTPWRSTASTTASPISRCIRLTSSPP